MASPHQRADLANNNVAQWEEDGKIGLTLSPKALNIIWGGPASGSRYWRHAVINEDDGITYDAVELVGAYWLELTGKVPHSLLSPGTTYKFSVTLRLTPEASGWDDTVVALRVYSPDKIVASAAVDLSEYSDGEWADIPDGGLEYFVPADDAGALSFSMYEIEGERWKRGLVIREVNLVPQLPQAKLRTII